MHLIWWRSLKELLFCIVYQNIPYEEDIRVPIRYVKTGFFPSFYVIFVTEKTFSP